MEFDATWLKRQNSNYKYFFIFHFEQIGQCSIQSNVVEKWKSIITKL